jgi:putative SOS response-associated peptidase YedK
MRWGLIPCWAKDIKIDYQCDGRDGGHQTAISRAFKRRRCLVPIEAFYEWKKVGLKEKQPCASVYLGVTRFEMPSHSLSSASKIVAAASVW